MKVLVIILILLLLIMFDPLVRKIQCLQKTIQHLKELPSFEPNLIDCYVKFVGKIETENQFKTPFTQKNCAFYNSRVIAHWETKKRKPNKGLEKHNKILFDDKSSVTELEMVNNKGRIYVNIQKFAAKGELNLHSSDSTIQSCPECCSNKINRRYRQYQVLERWCSHLDKVIIYGRIVTTTGRLSIVPTGLLEFPSLLLVGNTRVKIRDLTYHFEQKIVKLRIIVVLTLGVIILLSVGLVLY
jgi:hypothetical protein